MALPKLNETLNFTTKIPSTGETVKYRPYLVKEEKVLLQALESENLKLILETMCNTIEACLDKKSGVKVDTLSTFDVEYLFTQIRASSVGETSTIMVKCKSCETQNPVTVDLTELEVKVGEMDKVIHITDDISVEMQYPSYKTLIEGDFENLEEGNTEQIIKVVAGSISAVLTEEERIDAKKETPEAMSDFLNSFTANQFQNIAKFLQEMPALEKDVEFDCENCQTHNETQLRGLADFF